MKQDTNKFQAGQPIIAQLLALIPEDIFKQAVSEQITLTIMTFNSGNKIITPIELFSEAFIKQKLDYLHNNPVEAGFVRSPEMWHYSSAADYYQTDKGPIDLVYLV